MLGVGFIIYFPQNKIAFRIEMVAYQLSMLCVIRLHVRLSNCHNLYRDIEEKNIYVYL